MPLTLVLLLLLLAESAVRAPSPAACRARMELDRGTTCFRMNRCREIVKGSGGGAPFPEAGASEGGYRVVAKSERRAGKTRKVT